MQRVMRGWRNAITLCVCLALIVLCAGARAEDANGVVKGTITDGHGKALAGASVTLSNVATEQEKRSLTDNQGYYAFVNLPAGRYSLQITANGFKVDERIVSVTSGEQMLDIKLSLASVSEEVVVEGEDNASIATQDAVVKSPLDAGSARTEISSLYIRDYTSPVTDFADISQAAPGTVSYSVNGVGNGQAKIWFRGFADDDYTMTWDGVPFEDANDPSHHSWAYVPAPAISYVDFDRSPGLASDMGPANYGGSIHMFSPKPANTMEIKGAVSFGSFNTTQVLGEFNSGLFLNNKGNFWFEGHHNNSDGYQTYNYQQRTAATAKFIYRIDEKNDLAIVGTSVIADANTPNSDATRRQLFHHGDNYLMENTVTNSDGTANSQYYRYFNYHVPTNFEIVTLNSQFDKGWAMNLKTYTYSYSNHQHYQKKQDQDLITTPLPGIADGQSLTAQTEKVSATSAVDKMNQYNRIGEIAAFSKASSFGALRFGSWAEWTTTNRYQQYSDPRTWLDSVVADKTYSTVNDELKFHEKFWTDSIQPYIEYQLVAIPHMTITAGVKDAFYRMTLQQFADCGSNCSGGVVGNLGGNAFVYNHADYNSFLPSFQANYRISSIWSVYANYGRGSIIPYSSVFDQTGAQVGTLPKPTLAMTAEAGTVLHANRLSMDADVYHIHFQNQYQGNTDTNGDYHYYKTPDSNTMGLEGEGNLAITHGLSFAFNGTLGQAKYESTNGLIENGKTLYGASSSVWVANAPHDTESLGMTYQRHGFDVGMFNKRIGTRYDDDGSYHQAVTYDPFWINNLFFNYTIRKNSFFDNSKFKISVNNLFDYHNTVGISPNYAVTANATPYTPSVADQMQLLPGRSIMFTFQLAIKPHSKQ
ncbi:TonB-dependent receptor [Telmatobacter bradus]|uniref:TonB-dependent receptor n=1 Tax=Telmatobacter bradus TaxID=474953 RepID=UPI003B42C3C3